MSKIFELLEEESHQLALENEELKQKLAEMVEENNDLNRVINSLTANIREISPIVELGSQLQGKVKYLSKNTLHLSKVVMNLGDKLKRLDVKQKAKPSFEGEPSGSSQQFEYELQLERSKVKQMNEELFLMTQMKESIVEELHISRQLQGNMQQQIAQYKDHIFALQYKLKELQKNEEFVDMEELELKLKKSEEQAEEYECKNEIFQVDIRNLKSSIRDCNVRLNQKDQIIQDLKNNIKMLQSEVNIFYNLKDQLQIAKDWKLSEKYVQKIKEGFSLQIQNTVPELKKRIQKLQEEQKNYDYLFQNQRNLVQNLRKGLEQKQIELVLRQSQLKQKQKEIEELNAKREGMFQRRQESLQEEYIGKFKSLRQFNSCSECSKQKSIYNSVIEQLKKQLEKTAKVELEKQRSIDSLSTALNQMQKELNFEQILEKEITSTVDNNKSSKTAMKEELKKKKKEMIELLEHQIIKIERRYGLREKF